MLPMVRIILENGRAVNYNNNVAIIRNRLSIKLFLHVVHQVTQFSGAKICDVMFSDSRGRTWEFPLIGKEWRGNEPSFGSKLLNIVIFFIILVFRY